MEEQVIEFETAKLAKKKGLFIDDNDYSFNSVYKNLEGDYSVSKKFKPNYKEEYFGNKDQYIFTTQSHLQKWIEQNYAIFIDIKTDTTPNEILGFEVRLRSWKFPPIYIDYFQDKYEGLEVGLQEALKLI